MSTDPEVLRRIAALEQKVEHLMSNLTGTDGATVPPLPAASDGVSPAVRELVAAGDTIGAIKQYRAETGCDLVVAKDVVEGLSS